MAGIITLVGMGGIGVALMILFHDYNWNKLLKGGNYPLYTQALIGIAYGYISTQIMFLLLRRKVMDAAKSFFGNLMRRFKMRLFDIVFISFCAGFGEELLFRGGIQPWLGVWLTALIFVALHGYLDFRNKPIFVYGLFMVLISSGFGYITIEIGIWSAAIAHMVIDIMLMQYLKKT